jgi:hypothetical protein
MRFDFKKILSIALPACLLAAIGGIFLALWMAHTKVTELEGYIADRDMEIANLTASYDDIGDLTVGYVLNRDMRAGEEINAENIGELFQLVSVPTKLGLNIVAPENLDGVHFMRTSLEAGTVLLKGSLLDERVERSEREVDIIIDRVQSSTLKGSYADIRVVFPTGEDFVALTHKYIYFISGTLMKLRLTEGELYTYNSMLVDKAFYGAQVYATTYVDPGAQQAADVYYPVVRSLSDALVSNPNALELAKSEMALRREILDEENRRMRQATGQVDLDSEDAGLTDEELQAKKQELAAVIGQLTEMRTQFAAASLSLQQEFERRRAEAEGEELIEGGSDNPGGEEVVAVGF